MKHFSADFNPKQHKKLKNPKSGFREELQAYKPKKLHAYKPKKVVRW